MHGSIWKPGINSTSPHIIFAKKLRFYIPELIVFIFWFKIQVRGYKLNIITVNSFVSIKIKALS